MLGLNGLGACLEDVDFAVDAITAPLDIHGSLVVIFDDHGIARELDDLIISQRVTIAFRNRYVDGANGTTLGAGWIKLHLDQLRANAAADDGIFALGHGGLEYIKLVWVDCTLHHRLTQAIG